MKALFIKNLKKTYQGGFEALKGIDLEVEQGDFFALLGPNGAGKSTIIGIITSLINKSFGKVKVFGKDLDTQIDEAKKFIGVVPQEFNFNSFEPIVEIVVNQAGYYGIERKEAYKRAEKYLKKLDLWEKRYSQAKELSGGMKRRLMIARALVHEPKLLILDEPTAGVDIEIRRSMWEFMKSLNKNGITIILTTHYLEEAENLCKKIAIIDGGQIIENTTMKKLLGKLNSEVLVLDLKSEINDIVKLKDYDVNMIDDTTLEIEVPKGQNLNDLFKKLSEQKIEIMSMRNKTNRLEELFLSLVESNEK